MNPIIRLFRPSSLSAVNGCGFRSQSKGGRALHFNKIQKMVSSRPAVQDATSKSPNYFWSSLAVPAQRTVWHVRSSIWKGFYHKQKQKSCIFQYSWSHTSTGFIIVAHFCNCMQSSILSPNGCNNRDKWAGWKSDFSWEQMLVWIRGPLGEPLNGAAYGLLLSRRLV